MAAQGDLDEALATLLTALTDRLARGDDVNLEQECGRHPDLASELRQIWGAVVLAQVAGASRRSDTLAGLLAPTPATPLSGNAAASPAPSPSPSPNSSSSSPSSLATGRELPCQIGDYELLEEIGRGGMGVVYRARQLSLNREVAVKMILGGASASVEGRDRFRAEIAAAARLDHSGIVPVYDHGTLNGQPFFSMKFIAGETLAERLAGGPLPPRETARLLAEVARAVHAAHQQGVMHRDLKPSNILIDDQGRAHVSDFGLAKQVGDAASLTRTGAVLGTPAYMAPEQAASRPTRPVSDVYSLGSILYHCLCGAPPFHGGTPVELVLKVLEQEPPPPRAVHSGVDRDLEMVALRCLQKPMDLRYASAAALADDLEAYLNDEALSARAGRLGQVVARMFRETHHAPILENWGLLWMWHSLVLFGVGLFTNVLVWIGDQQRLHYVALWTLAVWTWAGVFWALRRRQGPVLFVERQIAHVWAGSMITVACLFPLEFWLDLKVLSLSPMLGVINAVVFLIKGAILSGAFYLQFLLLMATAVAMALWPPIAHLLFGLVAAGCFFFPGLKYYRRRSGL